VSRRRPTFVPGACATLLVACAAACGFDRTGAATGSAQDDGGASRGDASLPPTPDGTAPGDAEGGDGAFDAGADGDGGTVVPHAGNALAFAGDAYVEVPGVAIPADFTIEAWVKPASFKGETCILAKDREGQLQGQLRLGFEGNGRLFFMMSDGDGDDHDLYEGEYEVRSPNALPLGVWSHVAVTKSGRAFALYVDGASVKTEMADQVFTHGGPPVAFRIGGRVAPDGSSLANGLEGAVDEVRLWSVARTAAEIAAGRTTIPIAGDAALTGAWRFDEGAGITTADVKGVRPGTLVGGPTWIVSTAF